MNAFSSWGRRYLHISGVSWKKKPKMKGRSPSSQQWLRRQFNDPYVKQAQGYNYRARSAFKLLEIDNRFRLLRPGHVVVDCGAAPGSWTQVAVAKVNALQQDPKKPIGMVIGVDLQHLEPIEGATLLTESDFTSRATQARIASAMGGRLADAVLSDMAPSATGISALDHQAIVQLCWSALEFGRSVLREDGHFLCKLWDGADSNRLKETLAGAFRAVKTVRPDASRKDSSELFLLGRGFKRYLYHPINDSTRTTSHTS